MKTWKVTTNGDVDFVTAERMDCYHGKTGGKLLMFLTREGTIEALFYNYDSVEFIKEIEDETAQ